MGGYKITDQQGMYFMTFTVVGWIDVFTREDYKKIIIESFKYCQVYKGLRIHAYVIMSNHLHVIVSTNSKDGISNVIRDFKSFTSKAILRKIENSKTESRKDWMLNLFKHFADKNKLGTKHQFWIHNNRPIELSSPKFVNQKLDYIHLNPVRAGIVDDPLKYKYSSARSYIGQEGLISIELVVLMSNEGYIGF